MDLVQVTVGEGPHIPIGLSRASIQIQRLSKDVILPWRPWRRQRLEPTSSLVEYPLGQFHPGQHVSHPAPSHTAKQAWASSRSQGCQQMGLHQWLEVTEEGTRDLESLSN